jgi:hypothetical protein
MVEKFRTILAKIIQAKGAVTFFGIMKMDDLVDKWSVVLCAPWATEATHDETFRYILDLIRENVEAAELNSIARISIFSKEEHLIQLLLQFKKDAVIENQKINGNLIHQAYVLESNQNV